MVIYYLLLFISQSEHTFQLVRPIPYITTPFRSDPHYSPFTMVSPSSKQTPRCTPPNSRRSRRASVLLCTRRVIPRPSRPHRVPLAPKNIINLPDDTPPVRLRIPRILQRPVIPEVNMAPIEAAYPELSGVPPEYIRERLPKQGAGYVHLTPLSSLSCLHLFLFRMLAALAKVHARTPKDTLPKELELVISDTISSIIPTHVLAVYSPPPPPTHPNRPRKVTLYPAHQLVLATHCSNFPILSTSPSPPPLDDSKLTVTLPVVPLCIPSADTFPILHSYLVTKRIDLLRDAMVPRDAAPWSIVSALGVILGVWRNASALGVVDDGLWDAIDAAWGSVVGVMSGYSA